MFCPNCGKQNVDNAMFCAGCGTALTASNSVPETEILSENPYETQVISENPAAAVYPTAQATLPVSEMPPAPKKKKKGVKIALILIPIVIVLAAVIGIGSFALAKLNSPLVKIGKGFSNLINSGKAYNYSVTVDNGDEKVQLNADIKIDLNGKNIDLVNGKSTLDGETVKFEGFLHTNDKEFGILGKFDDEKMLIYNGYQMLYYDGELEDAHYIFEYMTEMLDMDEKGIEDFYFSCVSYLFDVANGDKDVEELQKELINTIKNLYPDEEIDFDKFNTIKIDPQIEEQVEKELIKCLTDEKWLEENLGLSVSKNGKTTVYTFDISIKKAFKALYDITEPLIEDIYGQVENSIKDAVDEEEYQYIDFPKYSDFVDNLFDEIDGADEDYSIVIDIEMTKKEISAINIKVKDNWASSSDTAEIRIEISEAKDFSAPQAADYSKDLNAAKEIIEENKNNDYDYGYDDDDFKFDDNDFNFDDDYPYYDDDYPYYG